MKYIVQYILGYCARSVLRRYKPIIIAITGSVGKTTTRSCIAHVLKAKYSVGETFANYNSEFGVPLSILGLQRGSTAKQWFSIVCEAFVIAYGKKRKYFQVMVLEMGADKPGDIAYLMKIVRPHIAVVTNVENAHLHAYKNHDALAYEKSTLIRHLSPQAVGFVNYDNRYTKDMLDIYTQAQAVYSFGYDRSADIHASHVRYTTLGLQAYIHEGEKQYAIHAPYLVGKHSIYPVLVSWGIAQLLEIKPDTIMKQYKTYTPPERRMSLLEGKHHTTLIDSSYNAEPASMKVAFQTLHDMDQPSRKIAIIGDMLELGEHSREFHALLGEELQQYRFDLVCFVGEHMNEAYQAYTKKDVSYVRNALYFSSVEDLNAVILKKIKSSDTILVKGSFGMNMRSAIDILKKE